MGVVPLQAKESEFYRLIRVNLISKAILYVVIIDSKNSFPGKKPGTHVREFWNLRIILLGALIPLLGD